MSEMERRIGILGGTFDPPHEGHLMAARESAAALALERVLFVPAGEPWQKGRYSSPEDRFMMTVLATSDDPVMAVSRIELDRPGPTYTVDTLEQLRAFYGRTTAFFFILGADAALNLGSWVGLELLAELTDVIAVLRPGSDLGLLEPGEGWPEVHVLKVDGIEVSSTAIRDCIRAGEGPGPLVPSRVAEYIEARGLFLEVARP
ncbi:MAG: nicotinate (nicotinamide) nucleotide adenylyltransferase [Actinobacteria bacterium]|nr:nicotinate (nicotinamide) nucleotide adenylyltransferase [Actinomycetota bacterium]